MTSGAEEKAATAPAVVEVAVCLPLRQTLTYLLPSGLVGEQVTGLPVLVPVGRRQVTGFLLGPTRELPPVPLKPVAALLSRRPLFGPEQVPFYRWLAEYYHYPLGQVLETALPPLLGTEAEELWAAVTDPAPMAPSIRLGPKASQILAYLQERGATAVKELAGVFPRPLPTLRRLAANGLVALAARPTSPELWPPPPPENEPLLQLSPEQSQAVAAIGAAVTQGGFSPFLLHGVTASGKTEVYLQAAQQVLDQGRRVLVLLPEIALTQPIGLAFRQRFGSGVALWHSGLSSKQRLLIWQQMVQGRIRVVVGARSAIFAPLPDLGLIVVDEEHDPSYKNEGGLPYQARDVALYRGHLSGATVILGSATPAVTTYYLAQQGKIKYLHLPQRVTPQAQPKIQLLNLREYRESRRLPILAAPLRLALAETLARGEQALLFLNRRGYANIYFCLFCGLVFQCRHCSVSLTLHQQQGLLLCHYCGYRQPLPELCPQCGSKALKRYGLGTERLEKEVRRLFPTARLARLDRDTAAHPAKAHKILTALQQQELDILIGTQMITKGHNLPQVTLVGVVAADLGLYFPEYHAGERTFQLLAQVAGRAGRGERPGQVFIQTFHPHHPAVVAAQELNYEEFYQQELASRRELGYPPFTRLALLRLSGPDASEVAQAAQSLHRQLQQVSRQQQLTDRVRLLGPTPAPLNRLRGEYRWQLLLKSYGRRPLATLLAAAEAWRARKSRLTLLLDVDPASLL